MIPITAAGGVIFKKEKGNLYVLLIFRRGVWDLPKGKKEEDESIEECARREVAEEVGCSLPQNRGRLTDTYHEYERDKHSYGKTTHWYVMQTDRDFNPVPQKEEGIELVRWVPLDEARSKVGYDNLVKVLEAFEEWSHSR